MTVRRRSAQPSVACFCMHEAGHFQRLRPLIAGLSRHGFAVHVYTHRDFRPHVDEAGGVHHDIFSQFPLEEADTTSLPIGRRGLSYAATYAEQISKEVECIRPSLVIHDSFAVVGHVVAHLLGVPRVNVCAGHAVTPARVPAIAAAHPMVRPSPVCERAVEVLRTSYGLTDAFSFSYACSISPTLNIYCEPPEFLDEDERRAFEPVAFYGCLPSPGGVRGGEPAERSWFGPGSEGALKVYVSFGTIVWRFYTDEALRALGVLSAALGRLEHVRAIVSLGGTLVGDDVRASLARPNVSIERHVDQWSVLEQADLFVTHHGVNSTHEAIFHRVPMLSCPFFWDQPALARRCQEFGVARPLAGSPGGPFSEDEVRAALARVADERASMHASLSRAREWELSVMDQRGAVLDRLARLAAVAG